MTLVRTLHGDSIPDDLCRAYVALATAFLRHRGGGDVASETIDLCLLDSAVCATELHVDLRQSREHCDLITTDEERPGEIFNNLGHMFVLLQAIPILTEKCSLMPCFCAPTQQSDHEGRRIADLEGGSLWRIEYHEQWQACQGFANVIRRRDAMPSHFSGISNIGLASVPNVGCGRSSADQEPMRTESW
jgi:hypothetical protein